MAEKLKPYGFIRIHRSVVVNISAVEEIQPSSKSGRIGGVSSLPFPGINRQWETDSVGCREQPFFLTEN